MACWTGLRNAVFTPKVPGICCFDDTAVMVEHGFVPHSKTCTSLTLEFHVQRQELTLRWNIYHPAGWQSRSHLHQKSRRSLALHCSEGTDWCSVLHTQWESLIHSGLTRADNLLVNETCQSLCRWSCHHSNLAPDIVWLLLDTPTSPTACQCNQCHQTVKASPSSGNGTKTSELKTS